MSNALSSELNNMNPVAFGEMQFTDIQAGSQLQNCTSHRIYQRKEALYLAGDSFKGVYQLRSGSAKASVCSSSGDEHISEFFYPGDIIGIDGFDTYQHIQNIRFLETSSVVCIKDAHIGYLMQTSEKFRRGLLQAMSHCLVCEQQMLLHLTNSSSEQRVAQFLLDISQRFKSRGYSGEQFNLSMTRTDIASYLGMAIETLSRTLSVFQNLNIVEVKHRKIRINDWCALEARSYAKIDDLLTDVASR